MTLEEILFNLGYQQGDICKYAWQKGNIVISLYAHKIKEIMIITRDRMLIGKDEIKETYEEIGKLFKDLRQIRKEGINEKIDFFI